MYNVYEADESEAGYERYYLCWYQLKVLQLSKTIYKYNKIKSLRVIFQTYYFSNVNYIKRNKVITNFLKLTFIRME
jgi:hypothetical protein